MILINCNNDFLIKHLINLFGQKGIITVNKKTSNYFFELTINLNLDKIIIKNKDRIINFQTPILFSSIFSNIYELLSYNYISIGKFEYNPLIQSIRSNKKIYILGRIHNLILHNVILNKNGLHKEKLYSLIWPQDKEIQINKLDTHITNLKKKIVEHLNIELNFISNVSNLRLVID